MVESTSVTRHDRRRKQTRALLVESACAFLASDIGSRVSVQQLADRADIGVGSFYNHFANKEALFDVAIAETLTEFGSFFDEACDGIDDPVVLFANGVRMTAHLLESHRVMAEIVMRLGFEYLAKDTALAPRAAAGLQAAADSGRLTIDHLDTALACTAGSLLGCLHLLAADPSLDVTRTVSALAAGLLRMFGLDDNTATAAASHPLTFPARRFGAPAPLPPARRFPDPHPHDRDSAGSRD
ncbi:TetR/AcrR family transcriptional regulator [Rhodococcus sp. BP-349]|uniref:TetR/AcrR family transcriptional regulator n=1 Tax=unclassified Rhodococcus (in: high G+C Gram-positive bacteria) TaxID=192944 RepID=UPI001C9B6592|nr:MULTISPECIES: TetR/AcrR family transcriptional regulator [unclassified Rhodococcus (in: high G+C Gram-positive bacteria)]MBY6540406.1 TetR/AcrR family transcriptional regulator [Rhodococcus sp. BP-363]MBY6545569.1 TetR/AcrR family transcriptional regulator [Rhodococcus sp. BP-369]MBY6564799.1 TetR/AcrR family transcriptional regulator [Rhodococcus sp. BP-370]MBY6578265.1 TetR/AcrR family transcriptional regulator [Rhodococcus sp. BP-364]MBY6587566.1 TetR/AcrR family transcriptional regulato